MTDVPVFGRRKMKTWEDAKQHPHDASGIDKPEDYQWEINNGVYYPVIPTKE